MEGFCNLILDETVTMKGKVYSTGYDDGRIYENPGLDFSGNQLVMKENSNITIQGGGNSGADGSITFKGHLLDIEDGVTFQIGKLKVFDNGIYDKNSIISKKINKSDIIGASASEFYNLTIISKCGEKVLRSEKYLKYIGRSIAISKIAELPVLDASKYELEGWYVDADMTGPLTEGEELSEKEEGTTIYADYKQIAGDVTFQSNGGSQVAKERVKFGEKVKQPANPTKSGYTFKGWYKDAACTSAYDFDTSVSEDITLYAKWEEVAKPPVNPTVKKSITKATVSKIKSVTYSGFYKKPSVTVKYAGKKLKNGSDYTLSYKNNKKVGKATVTIKGKGNYTGTKKVTFKIKTRKKGVYAKGIYKVDVGGLAGHKKASSKSEVIVHYPKGKKLEVTKVIRKKTPKKTYIWLKVKYKGKTSYIYGKYVK
ncbi:MAG: InlB B-repeat-containing protein [Anaerostipes sp.]|nr:InlB B-repeat-containing protein [Anaerostipes sp.]